MPYVGTATPHSAPMPDDPAIPMADVEVTGRSPDPVYAIAYLSRPSWRVTDHELAMLLLGARRFNDANAITGRLVVLEEGGEVRRFLQWFEGPAEPVVRCLERIVADDMHRDIRIMRQGRVDRRRYGRWDMAYEAVGPGRFADTYAVESKAEVHLEVGVVSRAVQTIVAV